MSQQGFSFALSRGSPIPPTSKFRPGDRGQLAQTNVRFRVEAVEPGGEIILVTRLDGRPWAMSSGSPERVIARFCRRLP